MTGKTNALSAISELTMSGYAGDFAGSGNVNSLSDLMHLCSLSRSD
jgi:hypothetical protein